MIYALQRKLIYYPARASEAALVEQARGVSLTAWRDAAGGVQGWKTTGTNGAAPQQGALARPRIVLFHGNAGHALRRAYFADLLRTPASDAAWELYLFEYPGYGSRPGAPGEAEIVRRAVEAVDELWEQKPEPVFLMGESLGCAVAAAVARQRRERVAGLLLITPFNNLADVARFHYPFLPVPLLLRERYASDENLRDYPGPVAFVLAANDEVIPVRLGQKLYDDYPGRKRLWLLPDAGHNDIAYEPSARWWREALRFLRGKEARP